MKKIAITIIALLASQVLAAQEVEDRLDHQNLISGETKAKYENIVLCSKGMAFFNKGYVAFVKSLHDDKKNLLVVNKITELTALYKKVFEKFDVFFEVNNLSTAQALKNKLSVLPTEISQFVNSEDFSNIKNKNVEVGQHLHGYITDFQTMLERITVKEGECVGAQVKFKETQDQIVFWRNTFQALESKVKNLAKVNSTYINESLKAFIQKLKTTLHESYQVELEAIEGFVKGDEQLTQVKIHLERFKDFWRSSKGRESILSESSYYGSLASAAYVKGYMSEFSKKIAESKADSLTKQLLQNQVSFYQAKIDGAGKEAIEKDLSEVAKNVMGSLSKLNTSDQFCRRNVKQLRLSLGRFVENNRPAADFRDLELRYNRLKGGCL